MTVPELNLPEDAVKIAALVAAEFAKHKVHARREFAGELAAKFRELKYSSDPDDDPRVRAFNRACEVCAVLTEQLADLPPANAPGTAQDDAERSGTAPNTSERSGTAQD